jgi:hypothetical protein
MVMELRFDEDFWEQFFHKWFDENFWKKNGEYYNLRNSGSVFIYVEIFAERETVKAELYFSK